MPTPIQSAADVANGYASLQFVIQQLLSRLATCTLVKVISCTNEGGVTPWGTVNVQPLINQVAGDGSAWPHGVLHRMPYCRLQGGANAIILDPQPGDIGLACFASRDISALKDQSAIDAVKAAEVLGVNPGSAGQYDWSDGLYIGGFLNGVPTQYVAFSSEGITVLSPTKITVQAPLVDVIGDVNVTGGIVASGDVVGAGISLSTHPHGGVKAGSDTSGPPIP